MAGDAELGIIPLALVAGVALPAIKKAAPKLLGKLLKRKKKKAPAAASVQVAAKPRGFLEGMTQETKVALAVVGGVVLLAVMRTPGRQQGITVHVGSKR